MKRPGDAGYSLVALMAAITIALLVMGAALPSWRYVMKDDREEELIFRGGQIADAIQRYQKKNGNAAPSNLEILVKGRYLRKLYKDPMAKDGKWRLVHAGEGLGGVPGGAPGAGAGGDTSGIGEVRGSTPPTTRPAGPGISTGTVIGPVVGVASTSKEKSLRLFNGNSRYDRWLFVAGQPRVVGRQIGPLPPKTGPSGTPPTASPTPTPSAEPQ